MTTAEPRGSGESPVLVEVCQRLRAGWLPHAVGFGDEVSWWWGRPASDEGHRLWSEGLVPCMSVVERMADDHAEAWRRTLHPMASELSR